MDRKDAARRAKSRRISAIITADASPIRQRVKLDDIFGTHRITNSKELRKLRSILRDPIAREHFLNESGDIDSAMLRIGPAKKAKGGLAGDLEAAIESMKRVPWTALTDLKGDPEILKRIDDAEALLKSLRKSLSK